MIWEGALIRLLDRRRSVEGVPLFTVEAGAPLVTVGADASEEGASEE